MYYIAVNYRVNSHAALGLSGLAICVQLSLSVGGKHHHGVCSFVQPHLCDPGLQLTNYT